MRNIIYQLHSFHHQIKVSLPVRMPQNQRNRQRYQCSNMIPIKNQLCNPHQISNQNYSLQFLTISCTLTVIFWKDQMRNNLGMLQIASSQQGWTSLKRRYQRLHVSQHRQGGQLVTPSVTTTTHQKKVSDLVLSQSDANPSTTAALTTNILLTCQDTVKIDQHFHYFVFIGKLNYLQSSS